ncbi:MAG: Flagellar biosynthetic protein FlhB [Smithella sp. PtaU1.Bin162]|nr:MAG: Flagellar biosynthetic protein FlhB [Smithella sp. PtaU1.Bin162]
MAENDQDQERTEEATSRRRDDAREKGQVARSQELVSVGILVACLIYFYFGASGMLRNIMELMTSGFRSAGEINLTQDSLPYLLNDYVFKYFFILFPIMLIVLIAAFLGNVLQVGFMFSAESVTPKFSKIDPIKGFQKFFSVRSIVELIKNIFKICIISMVAYFVIKGELSNMILLMEQNSVWGLMTYLGRICFKIILATTVILVVLAILDYIYQRWEHEKSLRMTKQEIKDEYKNTEGDPLIKSRIRRLQREIAQKRMMAAVPKADVVITNPTHLAVAIRYDHESMTAPKVVAKGANLIAEKIKQIAGENDIPIVEDKPLAQVLYKMVDIDCLIPEDLYKAVAEVLAFVYDQKKIKIFG